MPYSKEHKEVTREKILNSAIKLFSTQGFDLVSIDQLMNEAGLTRGAFYAHFKNKKDLYSESIIAGVKKSRLMLTKPEEMTNKEWTKDLLFGYLSEEHINQEITPCPLAFLVTDIANKEIEIKTTYTRMYKLMNRAIYTQIKDNQSVDKDIILATTAMMIGSVAIGRALNNEDMSQRLLDSVRQISIDL